MAEISGALYKTVYMQFVSSAFLGSLIMAMDFVQAVVEVRAYIPHDYMGDGRSTLETVVKIVKTASFIGLRENSRSLDGKRKRLERPSFHGTQESQGALQPVPCTKTSWWRKLLPRKSSRSKKYYVSVRKSSFDFTMAQSWSAHKSVALEPKMIQTHRSRRLLNLKRVCPDEKFSLREDSSSNRHSLVARLSSESQPSNAANVMTQLVHTQHPIRPTNIIQG
jgi:hypothetical protein